MRWISRFYIMYKRFNIMTCVNKKATNIWRDTVPTARPPWSFGRGASLYRHRSQLSGRLWVRLSLPTDQFSEISFSVCNVRRGWFIGIAWGLGSVDLGSMPT